MIFRRRKIASKIVLLFLLSIKLTFSSDAVEPELYTILLHRAVSLEDAKQYADKNKELYPQLESEITCCKAADGYYVTYKTGPKEEIEQTYRGLYDKKFSWIKMIPKTAVIECIPCALSTLSTDKANIQKNKIQPPEPPEGYSPPELMPIKKRNNNKAEKAGNGQIQAYPESINRCVVSNKFINRIIAPAGREIKDIILPKTRGIEVKIQGKNAYLSFLKQHDMANDSEILYSEAMECHVVVDPDIVYTLSVRPEPVSSQTINLVLDSDKIKNNLKLFEGMPLEKKITKMLRYVMKNEIPSQFSQKKINKNIDVFRDLNTTLTRMIEMEGSGLALKEYLISLKPSYEKEEIILNEKNFLVAELAKDPIAISLKTLKLTKKQKSFLYIVERKRENAE